MSVGLMTSGRLGPSGQATYGLSNLNPKTTGLPFIVFISQRDGARHAARITWSPKPKVVAEDMGSYAIAPFEHKAGPRLSLKEKQLLRQRVSVNVDVVQKCWDNEIAYTEDAIENFKKP